MWLGGVPRRAAADRPCEAASPAAQDAAGRSQPRTLSSTRARRRSARLWRRLLTCHAAAAHAAAVAPAEASPEQQRAAVDPAARADEERALAESLQLLEWPALCRQVACFASTSLAAREISRGLRLGATQAESEELVRQTAEARAAGLSFGDVFNLFPVVAAAQEGSMLMASHLNAVAGTLEAAASLQQQLDMPAPSTSEPGAGACGERFPSLRAVMQPAAGGAPGLLREVRRCIGEDARVLDRASEALAEARRRRRDNLQALRGESERWARQTFAQKASENAQVMTQRGRLCVSVRAGRQGELPKGSVKLGASRSGATLYIEPAPLVALNNAEASLAGAEAAAQRAVLRRLTQSVADHADALLKVMAAVVGLDVVSARARHADWLGGTAPAFGGDGVALPAARHPLLLEASLEPLPEAPQHDDSEFATGFSGPVTASLGAVAEPAAESGPPPRRPPPQPVDLCVPRGKTSVIVTGPNTGGKTASMKTLGLLALAAKAGLFLPLERPGGGGGSGPPRATLRWFDRVLADIGDSQDLAANLSTFSGHVTRVSRITAAVTRDSLVLLDELGSGTDPVEGGALAAVLLEWLLPRAGLVFCTSHHGELKELPALDERFVSVRVEFDAASLRPTYRLLWGEAGESQALAVAEGLGFDRDVVAMAHEIAQTGSLGGRQEQRAGRLRESLGSEVEDARRQAGAAEQRRDAAEARLRELRAQLAGMRARVQQAKKGVDGEVREAQSAAQSTAQALLDGFAAGNTAFEAADEQLERLRTGAVEQRRAAGSLFGQQEAGAEFSPQAGETVRLLSMGGASGQVLTPAGGGNKVSVRVGRLTVEVRPADLAPASPGGTPSSGGGSKPLRKPKQERGKAAGGGGGQKRELLRVQLPENTADLRGMRAADAVPALDRAMDDCPPDSVLFVVHGHGTGAIKKAARAHLRGHPLVRRTYDEPASAGGCTVVEFK